jgi:hypothetical protein
MRLHIATLPRKGEEGVQLLRAAIRLRKERRGSSSSAPSVSSGWRGGRRGGGAPRCGVGCGERGSKAALVSLATMERSSEKKRERWGANWVVNSDPNTSVSGRLWIVSVQTLQVHV